MRTMKKIGISLMLIMLCSLGGASWGDSYTLSNELATDDGFGRDGTTGDGTSDFLYFNKSRWVAVQFDLPQGAGEEFDSVTSATVQLTMVSTIGTYNFNIWRMTGDFDETGDLDDMTPAYDDSATVVFSSDGLVRNVPFTVDVSSLLADNGDKTTFGLLIQCQTYFSDSYKFYAKEYGNSTYTAQLSAAYTTIPEPATMLLLVSGSLGVFLRRKRV